MFWFLDFHFFSLNLGSIMDRVQPEGCFKNRIWKQDLAKHFSGSCSRIGNLNSTFRSGSSKTWISLDLTGFSSRIYFSNISVKSWQIFFKFRLWFWLVLEFHTWYPVLLGQYNYSSQWLIVMSNILTGYIADKIVQFLVSGQALVFKCLNVDKRL